MQLVDVHVVGLQPPEAGFDCSDDVRGREVLLSHGAPEASVHVLCLQPKASNQRLHEWLDTSHELFSRRQAEAEFGRDHYPLPIAAQRRPEESLAFTLGVHVRGIKKRDTFVERLAKQLQVVGSAAALKDATDASAPEADLGDAKVGTT